MKNTIKNTVKEVYDTNFSNVKKTSLNQVLNKIKTKSPTNNISNNNTSNNLGNNNTSVNVSSSNNYNNSNSVNESQNKPSLFFPILLLLLIIVGGVVYYFRKEIQSEIKKLFKKDKKDISKEVTVIKDGDEKLEETKKIEKDKDKIVEEDKIKIKKGGKVVEEDKIKKETSAPKEKRMTNEDLKSQYSKSQIVGEDGMYCYLGTDDNMRHCINVYKNEICTSGDIYNRIDECLVPK